MLQEGSFALLSTVLVDGSPDYGVSVVAFDEFEELLWAGNQNGHLTSYNGWLLSKYTSFQALSDQELRSLLFNDNGVLILGKSAIKMMTRQGLSVFICNFADTFDFQCFVVNPFLPDMIIIGGLQPTLSIFSMETCTEILQVILEEQDCVVMRNTDALLVTGHSNGKVCLRDPMNMHLLSELQPHSGSLSDVAYFDNKLVTCGFSLMNDLLSCDPFIFLYDARTMNAIASIPVQIDPYYIRFIATHPNQLVVVSQAGEFQIIDFSGVDKGLVTCLDSNEAIRCLSIDVSPTGHCIAFGDEIGTLHVFANRSHPMFVANARSIVLPDPVEATPAIPFDDLNTPLSIIPVPLTGLPLLSNWPEEFCKRVYR
uniref:PAN2-PAN3 deadenylation complex catalytic subunit PAN2 N-terminal domain-containing protein n=1 Tax=Trichuris muris TaxID=70415 RepID=A0A5S6QMB8_TRIMR